METLIGFGVGYVVGTRHGRDGLRTMYESIEKIRTSPEVRQLAAGGATIARNAVKQLLSGGAKPMIAGAVETVFRKAQDMVADDATDRRTA